MKTQTLNQAAQDYLEHLKQQGKSENTLYTYGMDLKQMEAHFGADRKLDKILPAHVGRFLKSDELLKIPKSGRKRAKPTVEKTIRVMRMFFLWAVETGRLEKAPLPSGVPMGHSAKAETEAEPATPTATKPAVKAAKKKASTATAKKKAAKRSRVSVHVAEAAQGEQGSAA